MVSLFLFLRIEYCILGREMRREGNKNIKQLVRIFITILILQFLITPSLTAKEKTSNSSSKFNLHSINFVQSFIDVSKSDKTLFFSLRGSSRFGLDKVTVFFESPSGSKTLQTECESKKKANVGMILGRILFKKKSESGLWKIKRIILIDLEGNKQEFDNEYLKDNNFVHSLNIKGNKTKK